MTRPECDRATALQIFFAGEPQDQPEEGDVAEMLEQIRQRWVANGYTANEIKFELPKYISSLEPTIGTDKIPLSMRVSLAGVDVPRVAYVDGFPECVMARSQ